MLIKQNQNTEFQQLVKVKCDDYLLPLKESTMPAPTNVKSIPVWLSSLIQRTAEDTHHDFIDYNSVEIIWRTNLGHLEVMKKILG